MSYFYFRCNIYYCALEVYIFNLLSQWYCLILKVLSNQLYSIIIIIIKATTSTGRAEALSPKAPAEKENLQGSKK